MHLWRWIAVTIVGTAVESFIISAPTTVTSTRLFVPQQLLIQCIPQQQRQQQQRQQHSLIRSRSFSLERHCVGHHGGRITALSAVTQENTNDDDDDDGEDIVTTKTKRRTWEENYQLLVSYKEKHGNCNVPQRYKDDLPLGTWVNNQRSRKDRLSDYRFAKLDDLGFAWSIVDEQWDELFEKLKEYKTKHGNCNVPRNYKNDDSRLAIWVHSQRGRRQNDKLNEERIAKLEGLGFSWSNEIYEEQWDEMFEQLVQYAKENNGDCNIPGNNDNGVNKELFLWVRTQRLRKSLLSKGRRAKLDNIGLIWEDSSKIKADQKWNDKYEQLQEYKQKYGHCRVPQKWEEDPTLGQWVYTQRQYFKNGLLGEDRQMKLEEMDFTWKVRDGRQPDYAKLDFQWLVKFGILLNFLEEHGHCNVPHLYKKDKSLTKWVVRQRVNQKNGTLRQDRKEQLDDIGFTWSFDDQRDEQWNEKYQELKMFKDTNGHLRLHPETSASLKNWVSRQRVQFASGKMTQEKKAMLDEIGLKINI